MRCGAVFPKPIAVRKELDRNDAYKRELAKADLMTDVKVAALPNAEGLNGPPYMCVRGFGIHLRSATSYV